MGRAVAITVVALGLAVAYYMFRDRGVPSTRTINEIEAHVVMPEGAHPLAEYLRFYSYGWKGWEPAIVGVFLWQGPENVLTYLRQRPGDIPVPGVPGAYVVRDAPIVYDGGCSVVTVYYDESAKRFLPTEREGKPQLAVCNGA